MVGMACVVLEKCPVDVPCATADEESGSNLNLDPVWINPTRLEKNYFKKKSVSK